MKCASCGGHISLNEPCSKCGIEYDDMLKGISHAEMRNLFIRIGKLQENHESFDIEASLLACELENSSLIVPAIQIDGSFYPHPVMDENNNAFMDAFSRFPAETVPFTNSFDEVLKIAFNFDGLVINVNDEVCSLEKDYLEAFFKGDYIGGKLSDWHF